MSAIAPTELMVDLLPANPGPCDGTDLQGADKGGRHARASSKETPPVIDLVFSQLTDVFRIGLIVALVVTMFRTSAVTGRILPLVAGVVFVAVILPTTMPGGEASLTHAILAGILSNLIILVLVLGIARLIARLRA